MIGHFLITCPKGLPPYLEQELHALGVDDTQIDRAGVHLKGSLWDCMRLNLYLRTGHRVLFELKSFRSEDPKELYRSLRDFPWEEWIYSDGYVNVDAAVDHPTIQDPRFAVLTCKDAIVDRIKDRTGKRPQSGGENRGVSVFLYWNRDGCHVYLNTSGAPLSKRGYRKIPLKAPMQETLAAAVVMATEWTGSGSFVNPMCGSGTLAIEAALAGLHRASGSHRRDFSFMHVKGFDPNTWQDLRREARLASLKSLKGKILATDKDPKAIEAARKNAMTAGVDAFIDFQVCDFQDTPLPQEKGVLVFNPAYGERLGDERELMMTYRDIGDFLKQKCSGYMGYIFTGNPSLAKHVGLRTKRRLPFFNGKIECRLLEYELYDGTRKSFPRHCSSSPAPQNPVNIQ